MPPERNINSSFIKDFFAGKKRFFKKEEVVFVQVIYGFKELTLGVLLSEYPRNFEAALYLPDEANLSKIDRKFALNVI